MKYFYSVFLSFIIISKTQAQQDVDALQFSKTTLGGTARNIGVGGTMGSVGGDISCVINNPAGLAQFNKGEFTISPSLMFSNSKSEILGNGSSDYRSKFLFSNIAVVLVNKTSIGKLRASNWSFNFNRINNFTNKIYFEGNNMNNSYTQALAEILTGEVKKNNGLPYYQNNQLSQDEYNYFSMKPLSAYDTYLLNYDTTSGRMYSVVNGGVTQSGTILTTGGINEFGINWAGDFNEKVLVGIGLNFDYLYYTVNTSYNENDLNGINAASFTSFNSNDLLEVDGLGANLKAGVLVKPNANVRISAFVHTPTYYSLKEDYNNQIKSRLPNGKGGSDNYQSNSPSSAFEYNLFTPWRVGFGLSGILPKIGFLAAEYELTDYSDAFLMFDGANSNLKSLQSDLNKQITNKYTMAHTIKVGGEYSYEQLRIRAGYVYRTGVFNNKINQTFGDQAVSNYTAGVGYRGDFFGFDLAYIRSVYKDYTSLYTVGISEVGLRNINQFNQIVTTFTFKF